jgi:hypothetical protein
MGECMLNMCEALGTITKIIVDFTIFRNRIYCNFSIQSCVSFNSIRQKKLQTKNFIKKYSIYSIKKTVFHKEMQFLGSASMD